MSLYEGSALVGGPALELRLVRFEQAQGYPAGRFDATLTTQKSVYLQILPDPGYPRSGRESLLQRVPQLFDGIEFTELKVRWIGILFPTANCQ
jgi:hypothetical protein